MVYNITSIKNSIGRQRPGCLIDEIATLGNFVCIGNRKLNIRLQSNEQSPNK